MSDTMTRPATSPSESTLSSACDAVWQAVRSLADAADAFDRLVTLCTNPDSAEDAEVLALAVEWRDDVRSARGYLAGHHRLVSS